jgi:hypothetical protein
MFFRIRVAHFSVFCVIFLSVLFFVFVLSCFFYGLFVALFVVVQCLTPNIVCVSGLSVSLDCLCLWIVCVSGLSVSLDCLCLWIVCVSGLSINDCLFGFL